MILRGLAARVPTVFTRYAGNEATPRYVDSLYRLLHFSQAGPYRVQSNLVEFVVGSVRPNRTGQKSA